MAKLEFHDAFPHDYEVHQLDELTTSGAEIKSFPPTVQLVQPASVILMIRPAGAEPWIAQFPSNWAEPSGVYSCPNPNQLCVSINGHTFIINAQTRESLELPDYWSECIERIDCSTEHSQLIFSCNHCIFAWGADGLRWEINKLGDTDFEHITSIDKNIIYCTSALCNGDLRTPYRIDIASGKFARLATQVEWITRMKAADLIDRHVANSSLFDDEWYKFLSGAHDDPALTETLHECWRIKEKYPATQSDRFCNAEGLKLIARLAPILRTKDFSISSASAFTHALAPESTHDVASAVATGAALSPSRNKRLSESSKLLDKLISTRLFWYLLLLLFVTILASTAR